MREKDKKPTLIDSGVGFEPTSLSAQGYEPCNLPLVISRIAQSGIEPEHSNQSLNWTAYIKIITQNKKFFKFFYSVIITNGLVLRNSSQVINSISGYIAE